MAGKKKLPEMKELTYKERKFVEAYTGNASEAARVAGYKAGNGRGYSRIGQTLLSRAHVRLALSAIERNSMSDLIANRNERQAFWTKIMRDETTPIQARLKASELLGKSCGDFIDRTEFIAKADATIRVLGETTRVEVLNMAKTMMCEMAESPEMKLLSAGFVEAGRPYVISLEERAALSQNDWLEPMEGDEEVFEEGKEEEETADGEQ